MSVTSQEASSGNENAEHFDDASRREGKRD